MFMEQSQRSVNLTLILQKIKSSKTVWISKKSSTYIARSKTSVLMIEMELLVQFLRVKTISTFIHLQKFKNTYLLAGIT